jgi:DNA-binding NtrC family response regulator
VVRVKKRVGDDFMERYEAALEECQGNQRAAARQLGIPVTTVRDRLARLEKKNVA